jgi:hypothetical protein
MADNHIEEKQRFDDDVVHLPETAHESDSDDIQGMVTSPGVTFPDNPPEDVAVKRPRGVELKREMTQEDKELANAGYEHLDEAKAKEKESELDNVDIVEHKLAFGAIEEALQTTIDTKEPAKSPGLSTDEAKGRLARDGPNILTPPKKKSALMKVGSFPLAEFAHADGNLPLAPPHSLYSTGTVFEPCLTCS